MNDFNDRHVVVSGGTGALGTAVLQQLRARGAICHVPAFEPSVHPDWTHAGDADVRVTPRVDLSDEGAVRAWYSSLPAVWASIHCAGGFAMSGLAETSLADLHRMLRMNLDSCFLCSREAVGRMGPEGGRLVFVAARPALEPRSGAGMTAYTVSKAAVAALTGALGAELADRGVLVNAVAPSVIDTPSNRAAMPDADWTTWPTPAELAATICWLASPDNAVTSGSVVPVYGRA